MVSRRRSYTGSTRRSAVSSHGPLLHPMTGEVIKSCLKSSDRDSTSSTAEGNEKSRVSFGIVTVARFEPTVGDNPACSCGCPIALQPQHCSIDVYSSVGKYYRSEIATRPIAFGRRGRDLVLSPERRKLRLEEFGFTIEEMAEAARSAYEVRKQRTETLQASNVWEKMFKLPRYIAKSLNIARSVNGGVSVRKSSAAITA